jgi:hypothetical protein
MLHELKYPAIGPLPEGVGIVADLGRYNQKLYGEAIYGVDLTDATPDVRHPVGYPSIRTGTRAVLRRGFVPFDIFVESGMDEIWAVETSSREVTLALGFKAQYGLVNTESQLTKFIVSYMDRFGTWATSEGEYNFDDANTLRSWMKLCPLSDHQWNEGLFCRQDSFDDPVKVEAPAVYSGHQDILTPFEGIRSALIENYNIPYYR